MKVLKALLDFVMFSASEKVTFFRLVLAALTSNPLYTNPDIPLSEAKIAVDNFEQAILAAEDGSHIAISRKHDSEKIVTLIFRTLVAYVNRIANGDATKIISSGFNISSQPTPRNKQALSVTDGPHKGSAFLDAKTIKNSVVYVWEVNTNQNGVALWKQIAITTQSTYIEEGLPIGASCDFRVGGVTRTGMTEFCTPVTRIIN